MPPNWLLNIYQPTTGSDKHVQSGVSREDPPIALKTEESIIISLLLVPQGPTKKWAIDMVLFSVSLNEIK